jgi:coproporphyrinogen III oxidase-like Fe-S oxidoreductase
LSISNPTLHQMHEELFVSEEFVERYNRPGPRYTSYPTAPVWKDSFGPTDYQLKMPQEDGLVVVDSTEIHTTWLGRIFIRNLAMVFDPYLEKQQLAARPLFSKTL